MFNSNKHVLNLVMRPKWLNRLSASRLSRISAVRLFLLDYLACRLFCMLSAPLRYSLWNEAPSRAATRYRENNFLWWLAKDLFIEKLIRSCSLDLQILTLLFGKKYMGDDDLHEHQGAVNFLQLAAFKYGVLVAFTRIACWQSLFWIHDESIETSIAQITVDHLTGY